MTKGYGLLAVALLLLVPAPLFAQPPQTWWDQYGSVVFILGLIVMVLGGGALMALRDGRHGTLSPPKPEGPPPPPARSVYGSAAFADPYKVPPKGAADPSEGVFFGKSSQVGADDWPLENHLGGAVCATPNSHVLIAARTRAGKGTRVVIPTLLRWRHSCVVIDPKGENAAVTARGRASAPLNQKIHIINPWNELGDVFEARGFPVAKFNPLDLIDANDPNAVANAQSLARAICPLDKSSAKENFFNRNAGSILTAVFLWLADMPGEQKTLARVREIVTESRGEFQKYLAQMGASEAFHGAIRENIRFLIGMNNDTYSSIMGTVSQFTEWISDDQVKDATSVSTFSMRDFMAHESTIYLIVPTDRMDTQATWLRLMITAITQAYKHRPRAKSVPPCMFLIDEFPALQRIECIPAEIAMLAGYGVTFTLVVQGLSDLRAVYHDDAERILNNCHYKWFCNVNDLQSAKYLSDSLGNMTVQTVGTGESQTSGGKGGSVGQSINLGQTARPLMMPNEIMTLGRDTAILLVPNGKPNYLRTVDYWNLAGSVPGPYSDPPLIWDRNPLVP